MYFIAARKIDIEQIYPEYRSKWLSLYVIYGRNFIVKH